MNATHNAKRADGLVGGLILITLGAVFFLSQQGFWEFDGLRHWWPLIVVAIGVGKLLGGDERRGGGLWLIFVGSWLLANTNHWFGLTWRNSWPVMIIGVGVMLTGKALLERRGEGSEVRDDR